jgi:translocator protein
MAGFSLFCVFIVILVNALAQILHLGGFTTREIADSLPSILTPAGYTFSIWGLIYFMLILHALYGLYAVYKNRDSEWLVSSARTFWLNCFLNCSWILAWHFKFFILSLILMVGIFATLLRLYFKLQGHHYGKRSVYISFPISIYLAWIYVAIFSNAAAVFVSLGYFWDSSRDGVTAFILLIHALIGLGFAYQRKDSGFLFVLAWAYGGIAVRNSLLDGAPITLFIAGLITFLSLVFGILLLFHDHFDRSKAGAFPSKPRKNR